MTTQSTRCRAAIKFGITLHTRCGRDREPTHVWHEGRGLAEFPDQSVRWCEGDQRGYLTDRTDEHAWEEPAA